MVINLRYSRAKTGVFQLIKIFHSTKPKTANEGIPIRGDIVGPPNPVSNIRPITFHIPQNETSIEKVFRLKRENAQKWHEEFWSNHNSKFIEERREYEKKIKESRLGQAQVPLTADEMSIFYKRFLNKYWKTHFWYNLEWYKRNFTLLTLAFRVELNRIKSKFFN